MTRQDDTTATLSASDILERMMAGKVSLNDLLRCYGETNA
jgi:hypothetical protein